jgi:hypothetical protein
MIEKYILLLLFTFVRVTFLYGQFIAADGAFEGDGRFICSYKNPGHDENQIT